MEEKDKDGVPLTISPAEGRAEADTGVANLSLTFPLSVLLCW